MSSAVIKALRCSLGARRCRQMRPVSALSRGGEIVINEQGADWTPAITHSWKRGGNLSRTVGKSALGTRPGGRTRVLSDNVLSLGARPGGRTRVLSDNVLSLAARRVTVSLLLIPDCIFKKNCVRQFKTVIKIIKTQFLWNIKKKKKKNGCSVKEKSVESGGDLDTRLQFWAANVGKYVHINKM